MYQEATHYPNIIKPKDKDKNLVCLGISNPGGFNRDILPNLAVWKCLKQRFSELHAFIYYMTPNKREETQAIIDAYGAKDIELVDELNYNEAIKYLSKAYIAIHMYTFKVVGRLAQDCAALGVPMIGTKANLPNRLCFPDTSVDDYRVVDAVEIATDILLSPFKYTKVRELAIKNSGFYGINPTKSRVWDVINYDSK